MKAETREREIRQDAREEGLRLGKEQGLRLGKEQGLQLGKEQGLQLGKEQGLRLGKEQGLQLGWEQSRIAFNCLYDRLLADNRLDDLRRSLADIQYQNQLLREYAIFLPKSSS